MDGEDISIKDGNDGTRRRKRHEAKRNSRKRERYSDPDPNLDNFKRPCNHNGKTYECCQISMQDVRILRKQFYSRADKVRQDTLLCHYMSVMSAQRHRKSKEMRERNTTICYMLKSAQKTVRVCKLFFSATFGITHNRLVTVAKVLQQGDVPKEKRGGDRISQKSASKKDRVREFISTLRGKESHYSRKKSKRIYLSASLSVAKLHKMYNQRSALKDRVSYDMFRNIFLSKFNIGFSSPACDICSKCTRLKEQLKCTSDAEKKNKIMMEYRIHRKIAKTFYELSRENPDNSITFCFDLQQVQPLPRTPIGDAFYAHQISFYALCCVSMSSTSPTFYTWTENLAGRGALQIGSALLHHLGTLNYSSIKLIRLFCDGCGGQNKNSHIIHSLMYWLKHRSPENIQEIVITYPVRGHSFLPADRAFGRVEKILKANPVIISKERYHEFYSEVGSVKTLGSDWQLYDVKELEKIFSKIKGISNCKKIHIKKFVDTNNRITVKVMSHEYYRFISPKNTWQSLLKKGKSENDIELSMVPLGNSIPEKKKKSLRHLMKQHFGDEWESREDLLWYKTLLSLTGAIIEDSTEVNETQNDTQEAKDENLCDCLHEESAIHI